MASAFDAFKPAVAASVIAYVVGSGSGIYARGTSAVNIPLYGMVGTSMGVSALVGASVYVGDLVTASTINQILPFVPQSMENNYVVPAITSGITALVTDFGIKYINPSVGITDGSLMFLGAASSLGGHYIVNNM